VKAKQLVAGGVQSNPPSRSAIKPSTDTLIE
jgi:hypothetical protein